MYYTSIKTDLHIFLGICSLLIMVGFIFIYSASSVYALETYGSSHYFIKKQCIGLFLGIIGLLIVQCIPISFIKRFCFLLFIGALSITALTLVPYFSQRIHGSSRWLNIEGFSFQPSELLKHVFIIYIAYFLSKRNHKIPSFIHTYFPFFCVLGITSAILLKQPDFGLTATLAITGILLLFVGQFHAYYLLFTLGALAPLVIILIVTKPYRAKRILTFINPWNDPQGAGFQIIQSLIAIGSGGYGGIGIAQSKQKFFYLPMQHTDFIFSIIAEETGLIGSFFLITLFILFAYFGIKLALSLKDPFIFFVLLGFVILTSLQAIINLAVATGLAPTKGIGLPFVSYGNSALICNITMLGVIINITRAEYKKSLSLF